MHVLSIYHLTAGLSFPNARASFLLMRRTCGPYKFRQDSGREFLKEDISETKRVMFSSYFIDSNSTFTLIYTLPRCFKSSTGTVAENGLEKVNNSTKLEVLPRRCLAGGCEMLRFLLSSGLDFSHFSFAWASDSRVDLILYSLVRHMASNQFDHGPDRHPDPLQAHSKRTNTSELSAYSPRTERSRLGVDFQPSEYSVICGRGKASFDHPGNHHLRMLASVFVADYSQAGRKLLKSAIVANIRCRDSPGGWMFLQVLFAGTKRVHGSKLEITLRAKR
jgi:hypothetical protein